MSFSDDPKFQPLFNNGSAVDVYEGRRYTGRSQGFLDRRERACLERLFSNRAAAPGQTVLDMPCGYGRFAPLLVGFSLTPLWGDISLAMAQRTTRRPEAESGIGHLVGEASKSRWRPTPSTEPSASVSLSISGSARAVPM